MTFVFWPLVVLACAGINMRVSGTLSWTELIFDGLVGMVAGAFFWAGTQADPHVAVTLGFVLSHGLLAALYSATDGAAGIGNEVFLLGVGGLRIGATLWAAGLDHLSVKFGSQPGWRSFALSLAIAPAKCPFALLTSAVGLAFWAIAAVKAVVDRVRGVADPATVSFAGGIFVSEFAPGRQPCRAINLGFTAHAWAGAMPFRHELYHSRQYIYYGDWLVPFWLLGALWGLAARRVAGDRTKRIATHTYGAEGEVGNPLEVAAYRLV